MWNNLSDNTSRQKTLANGFTSNAARELNYFIMQRKVYYICLDPNLEFQILHYDYNEQIKKNQGDESTSEWAKVDVNMWNASLRSIFLLKMVPDFFV